MPARSWIKIKVNNLSVFRSPGKDEVVVVTFEQDYRSNNLDNQMKKRQYWLREDGPMENHLRRNRLIRLKRLSAAGRRPARFAGRLSRPAPVEMTTNLGKITLELYPEKAPKTVEFFLYNAKHGFYEATIFHRVIDGFMIQGGGFNASMEEKKTRTPALQNEANNGLSNDRGTVAMARTQDPHSAPSSSSSTSKDNSFLNYRSPADGRTWGYAVFGKVAQGMDVVRKIGKEPTGNRGYYTERADHSGRYPVRVRKAANIRSKPLPNHFPQEHLMAVNSPPTTATSSSNWTPKRPRKPSPTSSPTCEDGHYDNTIFHRVINGFMIQGGGFEPGMKQKETQAPIKNEANNGLNNKVGTIAMARTHGPALRHRPVLHQRGRQRLPQLQGRERPGLGLLRVRRGRRRHGRGQQDQGRRDRQRRASTRTCRRKT